MQFKLPVQLIEARASQKDFEIYLTKIDLPQDCPKRPPYILRMKIIASPQEFNGSQNYPILIRRFLIDCQKCIGHPFTVQNLENI